MKRKQKKKTFAQLKKKADKVFSKWIRERDRGVCITCGKQADPKNMQCGHFVSRSYLATRWDERNCACQCVGCNVFMKGRLDVFALKLQQKYGASILQELQDLKGKSIKWTTIELEEIIKKYDK